MAPRRDVDIELNGKDALVRNVDAVPLADVYGGIWAETSVSSFTKKGQKKEYRIGVSRDIVIEHSQFSNGSDAAGLVVEDAGKVFAGKLLTRMQTLNSSGNKLALKYNQTASGTVSVSADTQIDMLWGAKNVTVADFRIGALLGGNVTLLKGTATRVSSVVPYSISSSCKISATGTLTLCNSVVGDATGYYRVEVTRAEGLTYGDFRGGIFTVSGEMIAQRLEQFSDLLHFAYTLYDVNGTTVGVEPYKNVLKSSKARGSLTISSRDETAPVTVGNIDGYATVELIHVQAENVTGGNFYRYDSGTLKFSAAGSIRVIGSRLESLQMFANAEIQDSRILGDINRLNRTDRNGKLSGIGVHGKLTAGNVELRAENGIDRGDVIGYHTVVLQKVTADEVLALPNGHLNTTASIGKIEVSAGSDLNRITNYYTVRIENSKVNQVTGGRTIASMDSRISRGTIAVQTVTSSLQDDTEGLYYFYSATVENSVIWRISGGNYARGQETATGTLTVRNSTIKADDSITGYRVVKLYHTEAVNVVGGNIKTFYSSTGSLNAEYSVISGEIRRYYKVQLSAVTVGAGVFAGKYTGGTYLSGTLSTENGVRIGAGADQVAVSGFATVTLNDTIVDGDVVGGKRSGNSEKSSRLVSGRLTLRQSRVEEVRGFSSVTLESSVTGQIFGGNFSGGKYRAAGTLKAEENSVIAGITNFKTVRLEDSTVLGDIEIENGYASSGSLLVLDSVDFGGADDVDIAGYAKVIVSDLEGTISSLAMTSGNDRLEVRSGNMLVAESGGGGTANFGTGKDTLDIDAGASFAAQHLEGLEKVTGKGVLYFQYVNVSSGDGIQYSSSLTRHQIRNWDDAFDQTNDTLATAAQLGTVDQGMVLMDELTLMDTVDYHQFQVAEGTLCSIEGALANLDYTLYRVGPDDRMERLDSGIDLSDGNYIIKFALDEDQTYKRYDLTFSVSDLA